MSVHVPLVRARRLARALLVAGAVVLTAGCGGSDEPAGPKGSPENPIVNRPDTASSEGGSSTGRAAKAEAATKPAGPAEPGFDSLLEEQRKAGTKSAEGSSASSATNPCMLVTKAQAQTILGARLLDPFVAPQGPTCVYRNRSGSSFATVAVEALAFADVRPKIKRPERVAVGGRTAYCGVHGRPMLYLPLSDTRVLSIAAPCRTAIRFASRAAPRLGR